MPYWKKECSAIMAETSGMLIMLLSPVLQIAAKIGDIPHLNNSTTLVDPSVYGYGVQKRPLDDGGKLAMIVNLVDAAPEVVCIQGGSCLL